MLCKWLSVCILLALTNLAVGPPPFNFLPSSGGFQVVRNTCNFQAMFYNFREWYEREYNPGNRCRNVGQVLEFDTGLATPTNADKTDWRVSLAINMDASDLTPVEGVLFLETKPTTAWTQVCSGNDCLSVPPGGPVQLCKGSMVGSWIKKNYKDGSGKIDLKLKLTCPSGGCMSDAIKKMAIIMLWDDPQARCRGF